MGASKLTALDFETLLVLRRNPMLSTKELAAQLGLNPAAHTARNRLQRLRRKGFVTTNGRRGHWCRWTATVPEQFVDVEIDSSFPFRLHRELRALGTAASFEELAALMAEPIAQVRAGVRFLENIGSVRRLGNHVEIDRPPLHRREEIESIVRTWHADRSVAEQEVTSKHSLQALVEALSAKLA